MGFGPLWKAVGLQHTRGLFGPSVNHSSIKQNPNGTKLDRRSTGSKPRPLGKSRSILRMFNTRSRKETKGVHRVHEGESDCETDNGENARMHETNTNAK